MTRVEAENYIYESYLQAEKHWAYDLLDSEKRHPELSKDVIAALYEKHPVPTVNITGSKGKGSVACMIATILSSFMTTGLMTSPHLVDFNERFRVNLAKISDDDFCDCAEFAKQLFDKYIFSNSSVMLKEDECVSPIGIQCAMALKYFFGKQTDINIFEGGKGVRYDDVNNIPHEYGIINTIFLEHTRELGATLSEIAADKACIMTGSEKCIYVAEQSAEALSIIKDKALQMSVICKYYGTDFYAENIRFQKHGMMFDVVINENVFCDICIPLLGEHQAKNAALAMAFCYDFLIEKAESFDLEKVKSALSSLSWPGRMEIISNQPLTILDACIHRESARLVVDTLKRMGISKVIAVVGIPDDKDYFGVLYEVQKISEDIFLTKSSNPHYIFTSKQCEEAKAKGVVISNIDGKPMPCKDALLHAKKLAEGKNKPILILGTTSLVADVTQMRQNELL